MKFAVLGHPVAHSKSPVMHAAAYRALGLAHSYEAIDCDADAFRNLAASLKQGNFGGFSVTVPHKILAAQIADEVDASAREVGAANTLTRDASGKITAHNTDLGALVVEIEHLIAKGPAPLEGKAGVVIGTGGAARAAVAACGKLGAARVVVIGRHTPTFASAIPIVARSFGEGPFAGADVAAVIQATTCGMEGGPDGLIVASAIDWSALPPDAVALDVVYAPRETDFVRAARAAGLRAENGLGMLARQGALAFELWLGVPAPFDAMRSAIGA